MRKVRLDQLMVINAIVPTRSQAESYIRLGEVKVNGRVIRKPGYFAPEDAKIELGITTQYVSRAALKLASVCAALDIDFTDKVVLDVGSSTGGFTDYALQHRARIVIAVDVGTKQLHPKLRNDPRVELHEKTDIRQLQITTMVDLAVIDVSFISLSLILEDVRRLIRPSGSIITMVKPQFEAASPQLHKGVVKNSAQRREILKHFELWCRDHRFVIKAKADSAVAGEKGNVERFYMLTF